MDAVEDAMWWYRALHARVLDALGARPWPRDRPLLDAGCGTGGFLARLRAAEPGIAAEGLEYHPPAAARARAKSGWPVAVGSVNAMPFADAGFGAVVSLDVLCHAAVDPAAALAEMARVLAPGGLIVLNLPAYAWLLSAHDARVHNARRFTAGQARGLLAAAGLVEIRAGYWNTLLLPLMVAQRKILARDAAAPESRSDVAPFSPWADRTLHAVTAAERRLARPFGGLPAGGSIIATARRPP
ncbi:MAG: class I SAM-dependent methyltransferase [Acetobacteraceae bacterium]|nr:class I SAM-dependent methyltransferase [Acetobacteraceae bacterium]